MAISPQKALNEIPEDVKATVDRLEPEIDEWLKVKTTERKVDIFYKVDGLSQRAVEEIMRRYRAAGWQVSRDSDREGLYVRFKFPVYRGQQNAGIFPVAGAKPKC